MMYRYNEIKTLLLKHDYVPVVQEWDGDGCIVRMPHPRLSRPTLPRLIEAYRFKRGEEAGVFYNSTFTPDERFMSMPEYAMRLFVMSQITRSCNVLPVDRDLLQILDADGQEVEELEEIIPHPSTSEERAKEGFLTRLFMEARKDGFPPKYEEIAFSHGVHEGYKICKGFFTEQ